MSHKSRVALMNVKRRTFTNLEEDPTMVALGKYLFCPIVLISNLVWIGIQGDLLRRDKFMDHHKGFRILAFFIVLINSILFGPYFANRNWFRDTNIYFKYFSIMVIAAIFAFDAAITLYSFGVYGPLNREIKGHMRNAITISLSIKALIVLLAFAEEISLFK